MIHLIYFSVQWKPTLISYFYFPCLGAGRYREGGGILLGDRYKNLHWFWGVIFG